MASLIFFYPGICLPVVSPIQDGTSLVSNVTVSSWSLYQTIPAQKASSWKITAYGISSTAASSWNTLTRQETLSPYVYYGLCSPVVYPIDYHNFVPGSAWDMDQRRSAQASKVAWTVFTTYQSRKAVSWNARRALTTQQNTTWNTLLRIYKPGTALEELTTGIVQPVVHAIDAGTYLPAPGITWNLNQRVPLQKAIRFNDNFRLSSSKSSLFNTLGILVSPTQASSWMTTKKVSPSAASSWVLISRRFSQKPSTWMLRSSVVSQKAAAFRALNKVAPAIATAWAMVAHVSPKVASYWRIDDRINTQGVSSWKTLMAVHVIPWKLYANSPGNISTAVVHPIDASTPNLRPIPFQTWIDNKVVMPITWSLYAGYGFYATPESTWNLGINPAGRVVAQVASTWMTMGKVVDKQASSWVLVSRLYHATLKSNYNVLNSGKAAAIMEWNIGASLQGQIRQTSMDRTDFAY